MTTGSAPSARRRLYDFARDHVTYGIFILITLYFILFAPHFASLSTASAVWRTGWRRSPPGDRGPSAHAMPPALRLPGAGRRG